MKRYLRFSSSIIVRDLVLKSYRTSLKSLQLEQIGKKGMFCGGVQIREGGSKSASGYGPRGSKSAGGPNQLWHRAFSNLKTVTSYRSYSHSVQFFRPVQAIVRTDEANSMAFLQREFLPSNDTYKTKTSAGNTLHFIRGIENVTHSAQGETVFSVGNFPFRISEKTQRER